MHWIRRAFAEEGWFAMHTDSIAVVDRKSARNIRNPRGVYEKVRGSGEWWIRYVDAQGRYRREKAGTKGSAIKLYQKRKTEALQGKKLPEILRRAAVSFKQIADDAIGDIERRYRRPADDVARLRVITQWLGSREAASITAQEIESRLNRAADENEWSPATINHYRTVMSLAYRLARRNRKVEVNPVRDVPHHREDNSRVRCLSADEEKALRKAIRERYPTHELELDFALYTGLRQGNQYHLTWPMVDCEARVLHIPTSKNGEAIHLPLHDEALQVLRVLKARKTESDRVFISEESRQPLNGPKHWFTDAVCLAGIKDFHWHDLRHTFATRLRQKGTPLEDIADLMGHKTLAMTKRYAHISMERLHEAVRRLSATSTDTTTDTDQARTAQQAIAVAG
jgi:integrase